MRHFLKALVVIHYEKLLGDIFMKWQISIEK